MEFYFILYIAAIITLFSIAGERDRDEILLINMITNPTILNDTTTAPKSLQYNPDNDTTALNCEIKIVDNFIGFKNKRIRIDSGESIKIAPDGNITSVDISNKFFYSNDSSSVNLKWKPSPMDLGTYKIVFKTEATPTIADTLRTLISRLPDSIVTKLTKPIIKKEMMSIWVGSTLSPLVLKVTTHNVPAIRFPSKPARWSNTVIVNGVTDVNTQLQGVLPSDIARFPNPSPTTEFEVSGDLNTLGNHPVTVSASDIYGRNANVTFNVNVYDPILQENESQAVVGEPYTFHGDFQNAPESKIYIKVFKDDEKIADGTNTVIYTPRSTGTIVFRRYKIDIDTVDLGCPFSVDVKDPQPPDIGTFRYENNGGNDYLVVTCNSYGRDTTGKPNYAHIKFKMGGDNIQNLNPVPDIMNVGIQHIQTWRFPLNLPTNVEITVKIYAIDNRGNNCKEIERRIKH